ncbi:MAG TPA: hypothetical protein VK896_10185 [Gaiellaceae bacterium]|nr:hypothetical protein [Gaiellaceae bacterium]
MNAPAPPTGRLRVTVGSADPYGIDHPISVIHGSTLELVKTSSCNTEISLPVGTYVVSTTLPSGERSVGVAEVVSDELAELALAVAEPAPAAAAPPPPAAAPPADAFVPGSAGGPERPVTRSAAPPASPWHVRFHVRTHEGAYELEETPVSVVSRAPDRVELDVSASGNGLLVAQVAMPGETPLNVALPIYGPTSSQRCRLTIEPGAPGTVANVSLPDNPRVDAVARYLSGGHLREAADLSTDAELLLQAKMADPFGAAVGGYALLRLGRLDALHDWSLNLANWFPWLPDGAVIAGEARALTGDHEAAIELICQAGRRGLPVFSVGLSVLASRLREYAAAPKDAFGANAERVDEAGRLLGHVLEVKAFADFDRVSLAFRGERVDDPATSQTPVSDFRSGGWRNVGEL